MLCPKCKKQLKDGSKFCGYCGKRFNVTVLQSTVELTPTISKPSFNSSLAPKCTSQPNSSQTCDTAKCKYCGSTSLQAMKQGISVGKAVTGALLVGPLGLAAGAVGMNNTKIVCLKCGKEQ